MREALRLVRRYGVSLSATALAVLLTLVLWPLSQRFPFALFIAAVMVSVWQGGPRSALLTTALSATALTLLYLFLSETHLTDLQQEYLPRLGMFILVGFLATYLSRECWRAVRALDQIHATLASIGEGLILTNDQGQVTFLSPVAQSLTGWKPDDLAGQPLEQVFRLVDAETLQTLANPVTTTLYEGAGTALADHALLLSTSGATTPIAGRITPLRGEDNRLLGLGLAFHDATPQRKAERAWHERLEAETILRAKTERALQDSEQRLAGFLENLPGIVFLKDGQGRYLSVNDAYEQILQAEPGAGPGATAEEPDAAPPTHPFEQLEREVHETKQAAEREIVVRVNESEKHYCVRIFPVSNGSEDAGILGGIGLDISPQKQTEAALHQARTELERQFEEGMLAQQRAEELLRQAHADLERAEESLRNAHADLEKEMQERLNEQEQAAEALRQARTDSQEEIEVRSRAQRQAEEALRLARAEFERQLEEHSAAQQQAEETLRRIQADCQRQVEAQASAQAAAEEALRQARAGFDKQLEEWTAKHQETEESLHQALENRDRQLQESSVAQQVEESLRLSCRDLEKQLEERTAAQQQALEALRMLQRESERQVEERATEHTAALAVLQAELAQSKQEEVSLRQRQAQLQQDLRHGKQAEEHIRQRLEFFQAVVESLDVGVIACDPDRVGLIWNRAARTLHGLPVEAPPGDCWQARQKLYLLDPEGPAQGENLPLEQALQGQPIRSWELVLAAEQGPPRTATASAGPLVDVHGRKLGAVLVLHDLTDYKQAVDQLQREKELLQAQAEVRAESRPANGPPETASAAPRQLGPHQSGDWLTFN